MHVQQITYTGTTTPSACGTSSSTCRARLRVRRVLSAWGRSETSTQSFSFVFFLSLFLCSRHLTTSAFKPALPVFFLVFSSSNLQSEENALLFFPGNRKNERRHSILVSCDALGSSCQRVFLGAPHGAIEKPSFASSFESSSRTADTEAMLRSRWPVDWVGTFTTISDVFWRLRFSVGKLATEMSRSAEVC